MQIFRNAKSLYNRNIIQHTLLDYDLCTYINDRLSYRTDTPYLSDYDDFKIKSIREAIFGRARWAQCSIRKIGLNMRSDSIKKFKL